MTSSKISSLRSLMNDKNFVGDKPIDVYLLPRTDSHQNEYLRKCDERVQFLTGFSGSNAFVLVTHKKALLWTDGRYFLQAERELESGWILMKEGLPESVTFVEWLIENLDRGSRIGFDADLFTYEKVTNLTSNLKIWGMEVIPLKQNMIDFLWSDRLICPLQEVIALCFSEHGCESEKKIEKVREQLSKKKCKATVISELDDIAWLLNIRGADIPYNPLVFSFIVITMDEVHFFVDKKRLAEKFNVIFKNIIIHDYDDVSCWLQTWAEKQYIDDPYFKVLVSLGVNYALGSIFKKQNVFVDASPVESMKVIKNKEELEGSRQAHLRDSALIIQFLFWLENEVKTGKEISEISSAEYIDCLRSKAPKFMGLSFSTICAINANSALPHYSATQATNQLLSQHSVFLIDSGAHYRDGTTDVTRTLCFSNKLDEDFRRDFTLVLKGHIKTASLFFPESINGIRLDMLSRESLWADGYDFDHGVGHGVGHFLNVHERSVRISYRGFDPRCSLREGMIITIEPGIYIENKWGVRIENCYELIRAKNLRSKSNNFLSFRALTYVPIQTSLIIRELLTEDEIIWLNSYNDKCLKRVGPLLAENSQQNALDWLCNACKPI